MPVPTQSSANPHHTDRDLLTSPMDDLPVVVPAQAGAHSVAGDQVAYSTTTSTQSDAHTGSTHHAPTHTRSSNEPPNPGDPTSTYGSSSPRPSSHQTQSNGIQHTSGNGNGNNGSHVQTQQETTETQPDAEVSGERTGERDRESDEETMGLPLSEEEREIRARIDLQRALDDLRKELGGLNEADLTR